MDEEIVKQSLRFKGNIPNVCYSENNCVILYICTADYKQNEIKYFKKEVALFLFE